MKKNDIAELVKHMNKKTYTQSIAVLIKHVSKALGEDTNTLSKKFGISKQAISSWYRIGVPDCRCHEFSAMLHNIIQPEIMRPDVFLTAEEQKNVDFELNEKIVLKRLEKWQEGK